MNKLAIQSIVLDSIQCDIDDFIGLRLYCSSINEKVIVSSGDVILKGEVRWGKGEFLVNIPFLELRDKLSCFLFNKLDFSWWLSYDYELISSLYLSTKESITFFRMTLIFLFSKFSSSSNSKYETLSGSGFL